MMRQESQVLRDAHKLRLIADLRKISITVFKVIGISSKKRVKNSRSDFYGVATLISPLRDSFLFSQEPERSQYLHWTT